MLRPTSRTSNTDKGSCTRTGTSASACHLPLTRAKCSDWLGLSLNAWAVNSPCAVCSTRVPTFSTKDSVRLRYSMRSAMVPILRPCSAAKICRSGKRAMVPSSFMISQITEEGLHPAIVPKSHPASVWPARMSTPPSTACKGKMWPG